MINQLNIEKMIIIQSKEDVSFDQLGKEVKIITNEMDHVGIVTSVSEPCAYSNFEQSEIELDHNQTIIIK